jgi:DNA-binding transcriptional LysR family regulator
MRIRLTLAQLEAFLHVAEHCSFRGAARTLNISQPALSRTVRLTEEALQTRLFDRDTRRAKLTPAGEELLPIARRILREFENSFTELSHFILGGTGRVTIAALPSIAVSTLPKAIAAFREHNPEVAFVLKDNNAAVLLDHLNDGTADFAITVQPVAKDRFEFRPVVDDEFMLVCRSDDPFASAPDASWKAFEARPLIAISGTSSIRAITDEAMRAEGVVARAAFEVSSWTVAARLVEQGLGIAAMPGLTTKLADFSELAFRPLRPQVNRRIGIVTVRGRTLSPISTRFLSYLLGFIDRSRVRTEAESDVVTDISVRRKKLLSVAGRNV